MSVLGMHVDSAETLRPLAWRRMVWVIWRQHRVALAAVAALVGGLSFVLFLVGIQLHHAYTAAAACRPAGSPVCADVVNRFNGMDAFLANGFVLQAWPALLGAFGGAPLRARELDTGPYR